jgi:cyclopropane-fatty-acyl-phospholipid synthase
MRRPNRRQGLRRARTNIEYHYDLGNDLFRLMLDETMTYSCTMFAHPDEERADAQRRKLRRVCDRLALTPDDHVVEIDCGLGSFALTAAGEYGLDNRVRIVEEDYRVHQGSHSKLASIEMIEAIGERQFPVFFAACDRLLAPGGCACIQSILIPDHRWNRYRRSPDWIERIDYAETLRRWGATFLARLGDVRALGYDEHFLRTWDFYLACCEAGFRTRALRNAQIVLER